MQVNEEELDRRFDHHPPRDPGVGLIHEAVLAECKRLARKIDSLCPDGREKALALTAIEEAMMWANAAVARGRT
jgi:hypothetical protein